MSDSSAKLASSPRKRGPSGVQRKTLGSLPAFAGTKGRGNDEEIVMYLRKAQ
jgi:hypothetical protein